MYKLFLCILFKFFITAVRANDIKWDIIPIESNKTQCIYRPDEYILSCRASSRIIDCQALFENLALIPFGLDIFGIARESYNRADPESRYLMYPRTIENFKYFDYVFNVENSTLELSIFNENSKSSLGLRIFNLDCWNKILEIFNESINDHFVTLDDTTVVALMGELLVTRKPVKKRWIGWGLGWTSGWGWGLNGWGLPLCDLPWGS